MASSGLVVEARALYVAQIERLFGEPAYHFFHSQAVRIARYMDSDADAQLELRRFLSEVRHWNRPDTHRIVQGLCARWPDLQQAPAVADKVVRIDESIMGLPPRDPASLCDPDEVLHALLAEAAAVFLDNMRLFRAADGLELETNAQQALAALHGRGVVYRALGTLLRSAAPAAPAPVTPVTPAVPVTAAVPPAPVPAVLVTPAVPAAPPEPPVPAPLAGPEVPEVPEVPVELGGEEAPPGALEPSEPSEDASEISDASVGAPRVKRITLRSDVESESSSAGADSPEELAGSSEEESGPTSREYFYVRRKNGRTFITAAPATHPSAYISGSSSSSGSDSDEDTSHAPPRKSRGAPPRDARVFLQPTGVSRQSPKTATAVPKSVR